MEHLVISKIGDRNYNADYLIADSDKGIFILADGAGNHVPAKKASNSASNYAYDVLCTNSNPPEELVLKAMREANRIREEFPGVASTLDILLLNPDDLIQGHIGHVGDARIVLVRNGEIKPLTQDHQEPYRDELQKYIGEDILKPDIFSYAFQEGDVIAMMTDGIYKGIYKDDLTNILKSGKSLDDLMYEFKLQIHMNMESEMTGPQDNYSLILIRC